VPPAQSFVGAEGHRMRFHADLHVHSKYSRATSHDLDFEHLFYWAARGLCARTA